MRQAASLDFVVTLTQTGETGWVEVCGEQAEAEPEIKGDQGSGPDCTRDVVVTTTGTPTCVPTAVDAGATYGGGEPRDAATVAGLAGVLITLGLVLWADRRRRNEAS